MKKYLRIATLILSVAAVLYTQDNIAQITVNSGDFPSTVGTQTMFYEGQCANIAFDVEGSGPNHTWDFSQMDTLSNAAHVADSILDPSLSPYNNVNLLVKWQLEIATGFYYVRNSHCNLSSTSLKFIGYESFSIPASNSINWSTDTGLVDFQFPMTYQSAWTNTATFFQTYNGIPSDTFIQKRECNVDGWGQIITPFQQYNCLRVKCLDYIWNDSLGIWEDPDIAYIWLTNSISIVFMVSNYETDSASGHKVGYIRYYDPGSTSIKDLENVQYPDVIQLYQNHPNPFNQSTEIGIMLKKSAFVKLEIMNNMGQKVCKLFEGKLDAGTTHFKWDGIDSYGNLLSDGIYYYQLTSNNKVKTRKMLLMH